MEFNIKKHMNKENVSQSIEGLVKNNNMTYLEASLEFIKTNDMEMSDMPDLLTEDLIKKLSKETGRLKLLKT